MEEMSRHGKLVLAAMRAGMDRKTARRYLEAGQLPSGMKPGRDWRTREDAFREDWAEVEAMLEISPTLEAKTIFAHLQDRCPGRYQEGQLRTLQRRLKRWRAEQGPPKEVFFPQEHRPGEAMQTDFTWATTLGIAIAGEPFAHMLCHSVLPYSNWESVSVCFSESMQALKRGVQTSFIRLGRVPRFHQTDHSTAATHRGLGTDVRRPFNSEYVSFCGHFEVTPRTTGVGKKEQNGDVEASNGVLKRRLEQSLLLRGSRDFETVAAYETWLWADCRKANLGRSARLRDEIEVMRPLPTDRISEWTEVVVRVKSPSTIRVKRNVYSVPSQLIGETVKVRVHEAKIEVFLGGRLCFTTRRIRGKNAHRVNYRHVIHSLVRKPGAFERYRYREELFPNLAFRCAYDRLCVDLTSRRADIEYLQILLLAAETTEDSVTRSLSVFASSGELPLSLSVKKLVAPEETTTPIVTISPIDLAWYDELLSDTKDLSA